jgi:hypothetical protein
MKNDRLTSVFLIQKLSLLTLMIKYGLKFSISIVLVPLITII